MYNRSEEVRNLIRLTTEEVIQKAGAHLIVCENIENLYLHFAEDICNEIKLNNISKTPTRLILPVGPVEQYPILVDLIEHEKISLKNCWFFFMDEYCDEDGFALTTNHPLSLKRIAKALFLLPLKGKFELKKSQIFFPDETNINTFNKLIDNVGGIDVCYGGIGIHGHVAFNEPMRNIAKTDPRKVVLNDFTITINSIRAKVGGNLENFPKEAFTIGMKQILSARKVRLYCRNGIFLDWANTVLRIALFGNPGDDYPVTYIRKHPDYKIITDKDTLATPINQL